MAVALPINKMSASEKIHAIELLWDSLCHGKKEIVSPSWHGEVLAHREALVKSGAETFEDWNKAKSDIIKRTNENKNS
jgi:hypothetical protein